MRATLPVEHLQCASLSASELSPNAHAVQLQEREESAMLDHSFVISFF